MKVLYLVPQPKQPQRIGAYTFLDEEIQALAAAGVEAFVLSTAVSADARTGAVSLKSVSARQSLINRIQAARFLVKRVHGLPVPNPTNPRQWFRSAWLEHVAAQLVHEEDIDLIHSHFAWPQGQGGTVVRAVTGRPLVASLRGTDLMTKPAIGYGRRLKPSFDQAVRRLLKNADRTVYFSRHMRNLAISLGARPDTATVVRKGVDLGRFTVAANRIELREQLGLGSRPMILTVAGLIPLKGIHHILEALGRLRERDFTFVVAGEGPERARLEQLSAELGLTRHTVFAGRVDRHTIPKYFAACDVFVLASQLEAAGNVIFEAMAAGRPVVCTNSGGPAEYVSDGETGFVVPVGDTEAIGARIDLLLQNVALREQLGAEARRRSVTEFRYDRMIRDIIDVYRDVLSVRSRQRVAAC